MTPGPQGSEPWMPNGFPPPSFVVETDRTTTFARGRWLAAAAILGAVLLVAGILLIANQGDDQNVSSGSTTTSFGGTTPTFATSSSLEPTASLPDANTVPGDPGTGGGGGGGGATTSSTAGGGSGTTRPTVAPGVLSVSTGSIALGRADSSVGPASGKVGIKNTGASTLSFTTGSQFPGSLTISPGSGSIGAGASAEITVTLDPAKVAEGAFSGNIGFGGTGGSKEVNVTATVVKPPRITGAGEECPTATPTCSNQIRVTRVANTAANPCASPWAYRVIVDDDSQLKSVRAEVTGVTEPVRLKANDGSGTEVGPPGLWKSAEFGKINPGTTVKFTVVAVDQFDATKRSTEQTITCPGQAAA